MAEEVGAIDPNEVFPESEGESEVASKFDGPDKMVFLTGNKGKLREAREILGDDRVVGVREFLDSGLKIEEVQSMDPRTIIGYKLQDARRLIGEIVSSDSFVDRGLGIDLDSLTLMVEDTSLRGEGPLNGLPGPLVKHFEDTVGNEGIYRMCRGLVGPDRQIGATALTVLGVSFPDGNIEYFSGEVEGLIVEPRGENGFGWDAIFLPISVGGVKITNSQTFAEMAPWQKNTISMRNMALEDLKKHLGW